MSAVSILLSEARATLVERGWRPQGGPVGMFGPVCASQAISLNCTPFPFGNRTAELAVEALASLIGPVWPDGAVSPAQTVQTWNDRQSDVGPVLALFDAAGDLCTQ